MQLIIDSGSTKSKCCLVDQSLIVQEIITEGINPYVTSEQKIAEILHNLNEQLSVKPTEIFYYGAGCSNEKNNSLIEKYLRNINASATIEVSHDLLAVARSLCGRSAGIAVILGTGSNSCLYDGEKIIRNTASLGYVLGDEGSGAYIGKKLIAAYLYDRMPEETRNSFQKKFESLSLELVLNKVYKEEAANAYLASFCKWASENLNDEYVQNLVYVSFKEFIELHILPYGKSLSNKIYSVGSIAYYFSEVCKRALEEYGYEMYLGAQDPMEGLINYHAWKS